MQKDELKHVLLSKDPYQRIINLGKRSWDNSLYTVKTYTNYTSRTITSTTLHWRIELKQSSSSEQHYRPHANATKFLAVVHFPNTICCQS